MRHSEETMRTMLAALVENDSFVTLNALSQHLGISKRSVQNYLNKAEGWLREHGLGDVKIDKKQGYGIKLALSDAERRKIDTLLSSQYFTLSDGSVERRIELLKNLLFSLDELTIQFLADQFYVSRFIILSDLDWAENWLAQYNLKLFKTQGRGIGIVGDEVSRRAAIAGFFDLREHKGPSLNAPTNQVERIAKERLERMEEVYTEEDIRKVCKIIEEAENEFDFFVGNEYFTSLATHLTISVFRMRSNCKIDKEFLPPDDDFPQLEMNTAHFIAKRLEDEFSIKLPESECKYICIHLIGYNAFRAQMESKPYVPENIEMLAIHLAEAVDADVGGDFSSDKILFFGLVHHLRSSIYQQKENPGTRAPVHIELPEASLELYRSVKMQAGLYKQFAGIEPDSQELISLTLHFTLSQARATTKWRALMVSNAGVIIQQEQKRSLQNSLPQIDIIDTCSLYQFSVYPENNYDFVISTVPLENVTKPVINIAHKDQQQRVACIEEFLFNRMDSKEGSD